MKPTPHLKNKQYYNDLYDRLTIEECRSRESEKDLDKLKTIKDKDPKKQKLKKDLTIKVVFPLMQYFIRGERYRNKSETIRQWMERDRLKDEKLANTKEPQGIRCSNCNSFMDCTIRFFHGEINNENDRVLFFFACPACHKRRAYWEGGEEYKPQPMLCPKCKTEMNSADNRKNNIITTIYTCPGCNYEEKNILDLDEKKKEEVIDPNFETDRKKYCLSDKEGMEYVIQSDNFKRHSDRIKDLTENKKSYDALAKLRRLTIIQVQNLLTPILEKENFINLRFGQPEMERGIKVEFTVQDSKDGRIEYDSRMQLKKLIEKTLVDTNWRLMSEGINYRLGILSSRLRGHESEEDLLKLMTDNNKS